MFTIGADPELFFEAVKSKGYISCIGIVGGNKERPRPIGEGCAVQEDNVAAEFNIPPTTTADDFVKYLSYNLNYLENVAKKADCKLAIVPSAIFSDEQLEHNDAREFGCEPDYNIWTLAQNPRPSATNANLRSAGGHIHIGNTAEPFNTIKACDLVLGLWSLDHDPDTRRRELYGKAGAFRQKAEDRVEYRTLSNFWIKSQALMREAFDRAVLAAKLANGGLDMDKVNSFGDKIQEAINTGNKELGRSLQREFGVPA